MECSSGAHSARRQLVQAAAKIMSEKVELEFCKNIHFFDHFKKYFFFDLGTKKIFTLIFADQVGGYTCRSQKMSCSKNPRTQIFEQICSKKYLQYTCTNCSIYTTKYKCVVHGRFVTRRLFLRANLVNKVNAYFQFVVYVKICSIYTTKCNYVVRADL